MNRSHFAAYYKLTKPGIIYGNTIMTVAGFLLAASIARQFDALLFLATILGTALVIASACVFNNFLDRSIDKKMARTQKRPLITGEINGRSALWYAAVLGVIGFTCLGLFTPGITVLLGIIAIITYVVMYGLAKRKSVWGTLVGSIPGALPPVAGYTAVTGALDTGAVLIFLIMVTWQMAHFYAIAIYRKNEYAAAAIPVWPIKRGLRSTKVHIVGFIAAFIIVCLLLSGYGYTGYVFATTVGMTGLWWLHKGIKGFRVPDDASVKWARSIFGSSLRTLLILSLMMSVGALLP